MFLVHCMTAVAGTKKVYIFKYAYDIRCFGCIDVFASTPGKLIILELHPVIRSLVYLITFKAWLNVIAIM